MNLKRTLLKAGGYGLLAALPIGIGAVSYSLGGIINAVVYPLLFVLGLTLVPVAVLLLGGAMPDMVGSLLFALGQLTAGAGWLVQHEAEWRMHPGRDVGDGHEVWIDGAWQPVADTTHQTRLGWAPFGVLWHKPDDGLDTSRPRADTATDGGADAGREPTRAGGWVIGMHNYLTDGLRQLGDIGILTQIEEVTERKASRSDGSTAKGALIGSIVGLVLGIMTGYVAVFGL